MINWLLKNKIKLIITGIVLAVCLFGAKSCIDSRQLKGKLAEANGQITILRGQNADTQAAMNGAIDSLNTIIDKRDDTIKELKKKGAEEIAAKDKELDKVRESWAGLSLECQGKLHELDNKWTAKFNLAMKNKDDIIGQKDLTISDKDEIIAKWAIKYNTLQNLNNKLQDGYDKAISRVRYLQLTGNLKWGLPVLGFLAGHFLWK